MMYNIGTYLNLSKSTTTAKKLQFIIMRGKFEIYISAILFERKSPKGREATRPSFAGISLIDEKGD